MRFMLPRNRTLVSTCGLSIEFKKGEYHLVPPAMYADVIAAGGVSEEEIPEDEMPKGPAAPEDALKREEAMFAVFEAVVLRGQREDFTAGGAPHNAVMSRELGWAVSAKERDTAWAKFQASKD